MEVGLQDATIGFVSTYPPTVCGLASYTASLVNAVAGDRRSRFGLGVVSLTDRSHAANTPDVVFHHRPGDPASLDTAIRILNSYESVSIQHEFGIFGGPDGEEVIDLISELTVPTAVTLHTVLDDPTRNQRVIIDRLVQHADLMVVMSRTAAERLTARHGVDSGRIAVLPHGTHVPLAGPSLVAGDRPLVLTWGLIGPGKGLETAIEAFADLVDLDPRPRYRIAGATHPNVLRAEGESYRQGLVSLVDRLGLGDLIEFDDRFLDKKTLARMVRRADLVVLPYESVEQVTSGVLVEAIAASKPVVATRFAHAAELLSGGAGLTVPHADPGALSGAIRRLLTDRPLMAQMAREAGRIADGWDWPTIGHRFGTMMSQVAEAARSINTQPEREVRHATG